jgi:ATP-dependent Clp protease ATP-binding subunit ClpA
LTAASRAAADLDRVKDDLLEYFVDGCRAAGKSWTEISGALGVSKQAAHRRFSVPDGQLERFTDLARRVVNMAGAVARSFNHGYVSTEHLLLANLDETQGFGARVLAEQGLSRQAVEAAVLLVTPRAPSEPTGDISFTPRAVTAITGAVTTAIEMNHNYVGTEHLVLALMRDPESLAARILSAHGIDAARMRARILELIDEVRPRVP